jgi:hypothetical protein
VLYPPVSMAEEQLHGPQIAALLGNLGQLRSTIECARTSNYSRPALDPPMDEARIGVLTGVQFSHAAREQILGAVPAAGRARLGDDANSRVWFHQLVPFR